MAASIIYVQKLKDDEIPTEVDWQNKLTEYEELKSLTMKIKDQEESVFREKWKPFIEYLKNYNNHINMQVGYEL